MLIVHRSPFIVSRLADFFSILLDRLLAGKDEYVNMVRLIRPLLRFETREPLDEAVGKLF